MDSTLQHEDLLIKLRAKLNEEKIRLWEPPYIQPDKEISDTLQDLAKKYSTDLSRDQDVVLQALHELQLHSMERSKANAEFNETGLATFRVKATVPGDKPKVLKIQSKLDENASELIGLVGKDLGVAANRVKLIFNGKVIKYNQSLQKQGVNNGVQIMALVMAESPEEVKQEDAMYMEMKKTRDDATLLSEYVDDIGDDDEYIRLENQCGKTVKLPEAERRSLLVGLVLHERGRAASKQKNYSLALLLLLEADRQLSECSSSILKTVDNWAVLQLDIAWCYLCLQSLSSAADAALRLRRAEDSFINSYGENHQRLIALKGTAANERVLIMRLYLLQGIVAYHQNKRDDARKLLERAEGELNSLRVDETAVAALMELGWSRGQARKGLRAAAGDLDRAHHYLADRRKERDAARDKYKVDRQARLLGVCLDGSMVTPRLVDALESMGYSRRLATLALRNSNNHVAEAVRLIQEQPEMLRDSDLSSEEESETSPSSEDSLVEPDNRLVQELEAMGYDVEEAKTALRLARNHISGAVDLLVAGGGHVPQTDEQPCTGTEAGNPSTSAGNTVERARKKHKMRKKDKRRKEREEALRRLHEGIKNEEDDYLDTSLVDEEEFLVQYKSLL